MIPFCLFFFKSRFVTKFGTHGASGPRSLAVVADIALVFANRCSRLKCRNSTKEHEFPWSIVFTPAGWLPRSVDADAIRRRSC